MTNLKFSVIVMRKEEADRYVTSIIEVTGKRGKCHETKCYNRQKKQKGTKRILFSAETDLGWRQSGSKNFSKWKDL